MSIEPQVELSPTLYSKINELLLTETPSMLMFIVL